MSIAKQVDEYVKGSVHLRQGLADGVVNLSALSRKIAGDLGLENFHAVHMALRRMNFSGSKGQSHQVLKNSRIEIRTDMTVLIGREGFKEMLEFSKKAYARNEEFHFLQEPGVWVVIAPSAYGKELKKHAFKSYDDVVELVIKSPPKIESTPGVMAQVCTRLADAEVNIIEFLSCWTDTILIINKKDLSSAVEALQKLTSSS